MEPWDGVDVFEPPSTFTRVRCLEEKWGKHGKICYKHVIALPPYDIYQVLDIHIRRSCKELGVNFVGTKLPN